MQTLAMFSVFDNRAGAYMQPFFLPNEKMATRAMQDLMRDPTHTFGLNPQDFYLYTVGVFDQATGLIESFEPRRVATLLELKSLLDLDLTAEGPI